MRIRRQKPQRDNSTPPADPHPDRACDRTCDVTDVAHDGRVFIHQAGGTRY